METIRADFAVTDDILLEASKGRLADHGTISLEGSGRIGPVVELIWASIKSARQYRAVTVQSPFYEHLAQALRTGHSFGNGYHDLAGAFPLGVNNPVLDADTSWDQWTTHLENIAKRKGLNPQLVASLIGALIELQDNIYEHSGEPESGLVAFAITARSFEFVVADAGAGVLQTLRQNVEYAKIPNSGAALEEIIKDGVSRFPSESGRGLGEPPRVYRRPFGLSHATIASSSFRA